MWTIDGEEVIVLGDRTTHGGEVITASEKVSLLGKPVACVGDQVTCPRCEGIHTIISGAPRATAYDKAIARNGDSVSCGAKLISASAAIRGVRLEDDNSNMVPFGERWISGSADILGVRRLVESKAVDEKTHESQAEYPYIDDDEGNLYRDELGIYLGSQPALTSKSSIIFENKPGFEAFGNNPSAYVLGGLTPNKGLAGSLNDAAKGVTYLVVYGDPKTGKPSSWRLYEYRGTGKYAPDTKIEIYKFFLVPNVREAQNKVWFQKNLTAFRRSRP
ncbi:MAG: PAAR domain-containing protein [Desulfarculales bacterium]|jgi:uncharacterized Zn-binding protein involved in type VI secretion|nr:PAAR domain-containing protein [Desulfarculales bacterium]